ncbi:MAG: histidine kinase [Oscillospiraceae bacterium]|nr:histidine kinase [Oscillospiraceae bacterium]
MQYKKEKIHLQNFLFRSYMGAMAVVTLFVLALLFVYHFSALNQSIRASIQQANLTVAQSVDSQIKQMDTVALSALYSNLLKESFSSYSTHLQESNPTPFDTNVRINNARVLHDLLFAIIGVTGDVRQVNLYNMDHGGFGTGWHNGHINGNLSETPWYADTLSLEGARHITPPYESGFLSNAAKTWDNRRYTSLCRMYFDQYNKMDGAIEVIQYYDVVFRQAIINESMYRPDFYIYDRQGVLIYPAKAASLQDYFGAYPGNASIVTLKNTASGNNEYVSYERLPYSDFLSVAVIDSTTFYTPVLQAAVFMLLLIAVLIFACYLTAKQLARRLAVPFNTIHAHLSQIDFDTLSFQDLKSDASNVLEIEDLNKSINLFQRKIKTSMDNILLLQQQEAQAQMLALQSQMNPHFLYNSLATIQAMAEAGMNDGIIEMSSAMTGILRYISSNKESLVRLEIELENTELYLHCVKLRYEDKLNFQFEIPDAMLGIMIPKLCVQTLVENAVKYATVSVMPPWEITVCCEETDAMWTVTVSDNGGGFSKGTTEQLNNKIKEIDKVSVLPSLELQGMGLINLYLRLRLIFKDDAIFAVGNQKGGGAFVQIGRRKFEAS